MAAVDFSNAVLEPYQNNPVSETYMGIPPASGFYVANSSGASIVTSLTNQTSTSDDKKTMIRTISGTFNTSGTEFYLYYYSHHWKVSNVSFASGDTFSLPITFNLT